MNLKERILTGWSIRRALYLLLGGWVIVQAFMTNQYFLLLFGGYFTSMGLFNFGCAAGACAYIPPPSKHNSETLDK